MKFLIMHTTVMQSILVGFTMLDLPWVKRDNAEVT